MPDNPDGFIDAGMRGITAENNFGGTIKVFNGLKTFSNSEIHAGGDYGISAVSSATEDDVTALFRIVEVWNYGYVEALGADATAAVYGETTQNLSLPFTPVPGDVLPFSYAAMFNGGTDFDIEDRFPLAPDARIDAYDFDVDEIAGWASIGLGTADGIRLRKNGGETMFGFGGLGFDFVGLYGPFGKAYRLIRLIASDTVQHRGQELRHMGLHRRRSFPDAGLRWRWRGSGGGRHRGDDRGRRLRSGRSRLLLA